jgi:hypothetical protein
MKSLWTNPLVVLAAASLAWVLCTAAGAAAQGIWIGLAAGTSLLASECALALLLLARGRDPVTRTQVALGATIVHLLVAGAGVAAIMLSLKPGWSFTLWIAGFFWLTLVVVAMGSARVARGPTLAGSVGK